MPGGTQGRQLEENGGSRGKGASRARAASLAESAGRTPVNLKIIDARLAFRAKRCDKSEMEELVEIVAGSSEVQLEKYDFAHTRN